MSLALAKAIPRIHEMMLSVSSAAEAKRGADFCKATEILAHRQGLVDIEDKAFSARVDFMRIEGEYLEREVQHQGGRPGKNSRRTTSVSATGVSYDRSSLVQRVCRAAREVPALFRQVKAREAKLSDIARHYKKQAHAAKVRIAARNGQAKPVGPFQLILADPPWRYEHCESKGREIENQYPTRSLAEIKKDKPNSAMYSILLLWSPAPKLAEALSIMEAWGFTYRTCAVWDKQVMGMGYWFRIQHELLLLGVRGNPEATPECARISSIFTEKRTHHSRKPESVYRWIEEAFPEASKLEMYSRVARAGWASHGNEI